MGQEDKPFRIASLNLLWNPYRLDERIKLVIEELKTLNPDVVCFQEVLGNDGTSQIPTYIAEALHFKGISKTNLGPPKVKDHGRQHGTAIITKNAQISETSFTPKEYLEGPPITSVSIQHNQTRMEIISGHLAWGSTSETARKVQAKMIDNWAREVTKTNPKTVVVLGCDFNAVPESDTNRFFNGFTTIEEKSTIWVDAWIMAGSPESEMTTRNDNDFAHNTAKRNGIVRPDMIPNRRIDYIKTFEWAYGKSGHPIQFGQWAKSLGENNLSISDHYGIWADLMIINPVTENTTKILF